MIAHSADGACGGLRCRAQTMAAMPSNRRLRRARPTVLADRDPRPRPAGRAVGGRVGGVRLPLSAASRHGLWVPDSMRRSTSRSNADGVALRCRAAASSPLVRRAGTDATSTRRRTAAQRALPRRAVRSRDLTRSRCGSQPCAAEWFRPACSLEWTGGACRAARVWRCRSASERLRTRDDLRSTRFGGARCRHPSAGVDRRAPRRRPDR